MPRPAKKPEPKPGIVDKHHIPIFDHKDRMRGHVGPLATAATVSRFIGQHGAKLGKKDGRTAWLGPTPPPPKKPQVDPIAIAVAEKQAQAQPQSETHKVEISVKQAMGSASKKKPNKPEAHARPRRG